MNNSNEKPLITASKLFLEVSSVIGKVEALKQLTKAYREYIPTEDYPMFDWDKPLLDAFEWEYTLQGDGYWDDIYHKL